MGWAGQMCSLKTAIEEIGSCRRPGTCGRVPAPGMTMGKMAEDGRLLQTWPVKLAAHNRMCVRALEPRTNQRCIVVWACLIGACFT